MAMDLAMDRRGNAFVLDVNTGPSYYHFDMPVGRIAAVRSGLLLLFRACCSERDIGARLQLS